MRAPGLLAALRPFLWLLLAAFLTGFLSYAVLGGGRAGVKVRTVYVAACAPAAGAWNLPKRI
jgi:hypothetical protein